jgi:hypothetical protein
MPRTKLVLSAIKFGTFAYVGYASGSGVLVIVKEFVSMSAELTFPILAFIALIAGGIGFTYTWRGLVAGERDNVANTNREDIKAAEDKEHKDKVELAASTLTEMKCVELLRSDRSMLKRVVADHSVQVHLTSLGFTRPPTPTSLIAVSAEPRISTPIPSQARKKLGERKLSEEDIVLNIKTRRNSTSDESSSPYSDSSTAYGPIYHENKESPQYVEQKDSPVLSSSIPREEVEAYELCDGVPRLIEAPTLFPTQTMPLPLGFAGRRVGARYHYKPELSVQKEGVEVSTTSPAVIMRAIRLNAPDDDSPQISQRGLSSSSSSRGLWTQSPVTAHRSSLTAPSPLISRRGLSSSHELTGYSPNTSVRDFTPGYSPHLSHPETTPVPSPQTLQREVMPQPLISPPRHLFYPPNTLLRDAVQTPYPPPVDETVSMQMKRSVSHRASEIRAFFGTEPVLPDAQEKEDDVERERGEPERSRSGSHRSHSFRRTGAPQL